MRATFLTLTAAVLLAIGGRANADEGSPVYTALDDAATQLREDFNRSRGSVRLVFVVDPICPGCLRGLADVDADLLAATDDPRLQTFVVHVPVIGAKAKDVGPSTKLLHNPNVHHYWNPSGAFGRELARAVGLKRGDELIYAWDVWLVYGPEATWEGAPPKPRLLMHQLRALQGSEKFPALDSEVFAREVRALLSELPTTAAAAR